MEALSRGTTVVRAAHTGPLPDGGPYVAITFDDAFRSVRRMLCPSFSAEASRQRSSYRSTFSVRSPAGRSRAGVNEEVMTCDELRSLPELIELGSHSLSHPHLTRIDGARLREEVGASRHQLAELLGSDVSLFAFPYGEYDERVVDSCCKPAMNGCSESIPGPPIRPDRTSFEAACRWIRTTARSCST